MPCGRFSSAKQRKYYFASRGYKRKPMGKKGAILFNWMIYAGLGILSFILLGGFIWLVNIGLLKVVGVLFLVGGLFSAIKGKLGWVPSLVLIGLGFVLVMNPLNLTRFLGNMNYMTVGGIFNK